MMKKILMVLIGLLAFVPYAYGVGTCTKTVKTSQTHNAYIPDSETVIVTLACTADASAATYPSTAIALAGANYNMYGYYLYQIGRTPGTTAPTGNYTVTVTDTQGFAIDLGLLTSNGSASAAQLTAIYNAATGYPVVRSAPTVAISGNAVNSAAITLDLVFKAK